MSGSGAQEHVLFFHDVAGAVQVERHPSLPVAVQRVEQLANDQGVTDCELFTLEPVRLQRQQRWHVAVAGAAADAAGVPMPRSAPPAAASARPAASPQQIVPPQQAAPPEQAGRGHVDPLDVEVVDEVFHEVVRDVARQAATAPQDDGQDVTQDSTHEPVEAPESADVLPTAPRGRGLGFFVHQ